MIAASLKPYLSICQSPVLLRFPRSDDRGLIEALGSTGPPHCWPDFRDQMIAASLKRFFYLQLFFRFRYFRDQMIAASLKPLHHNLANIKVADFRDQMIAASLK